MAEALLSIEVLWAGAEPPLRVAIRIAAGATVAQALAASGIAAQISASGRVPAGEGPLDALSVALYGRATRPGDRLHDHDRIELLPPLTVDPKVARQRRADHRRRMAGERRWTPDRERTTASTPKPL
jgi:putative ubiquitin-RnfH superfamily antitoxin RatB of RatAB toxin-antitoxin module